MEKRFPKAAYRRQLLRIENEIREWAFLYGKSIDDAQPEWLQGRFQDRYAQLMDVAHSLERARYDLELLPRLA